MVHRNFIVISKSFQITTSEGITLSGGLSEVTRGDANTLFEEFESVISELASAIQNTGDHHSNVAKLVVSLTSTMSDQGSVNPVYNAKLQKVRDYLIPIVYENWDALSPEVKQEMITLFSFFCKMHIFV